MTTPEQAKGHCPFNPEEPTPMYKPLPPDELADLADDLIFEAAQTFTTLQEVLTYNDLPEGMATLIASLLSSPGTLPSNEKIEAARLEAKNLLRTELTKGTLIRDDKRRPIILPF